MVLFPSSARTDLSVRPKASEDIDRKTAMIAAGAGGAVVLILLGVIAFLLLGRRRAPAGGA